MWFDEKDAGRGGWSGNAYRAERLIRARIAPILAAKDAELKRLDEQTERDQLRIAELEASLAREKGEYFNIIQQNQAQLENLAKRDEWIAELEKHRAHTTAEGKTPGQVMHEAWCGLDCRRGGKPLAWHELHETACEERQIVARTVLSAFGQNAVEALERVRDQLDDKLYSLSTVGTDTDGTFLVRMDKMLEAAKNAIDDEIAKLEGKKP